MHSFRFYLYEDDFPGQLDSRSCGGKVQLNNSRPYILLNSPFYYDPQLPSGIMLCYWYIKSSPGEEVMLTWLELDLLTEVILIIDYSSEIMIQVATLRGDVDVDMSPFVSSRGGIHLVFSDWNTDINGRAFLANLSIAGALETHAIRHIRKILSSPYIDN